MKKNVASQSIGAEMITASDGSAFTGTVTVYVTGDAGTQAIGSVGSGICTHEGNGFHTYAPAQAETNYDHIGFTFIGTGAIPSTLQVFTGFPQTVDNNVLAAGVTGFTAIDTVVDTLLSRIIGTLATGTHNPASAAQIAVLSDWINGGRLDLIIDLINAATTGLAGAAMRGTDGANTVVPDVAGFLPTALEVADAVWDEILAGATHNSATSAGRRLRGIQDFQGYENGAIWVDTVNGSAGTTDYENGTVENAVDTWADALTLNASLGFNKFVLKNASAITLSANSDGYHIIGAGPTTLAFNGQSVVGITVENCVVSGVMVGAGTTQRLLNCAVGAVTLIKGTHAHTSAIVGAQTVGEAGDYFYDRCHSGIAGTDTWAFDFGSAIGNTNLNWRNGSGGIQIESMGATGTDTASIEGRGQIIEGTCTGGTVAVRGLFETSGITNLTLVDGARFQSDDLVNDFWSDTLTTYTDGMAGKRLKSITAVPVDEGTVNDAGATTTAVITTLTGREDGHYDDALFVLEIAADQWQGRPVLSYNGTTGTFTFEEGFTSAPVNGSAIAVQSHHIHPVSQIADGILDRDMSTGTDSGSATVRTIRQALRPNRNKVSISGGVLTVYKEDDSTASHTAAVTTAAGDPIDSIDPAG